MTGLERIPAPDVGATITAAVSKRCPVVDETDEGHVTITYRTFNAAWELHTVAAYLQSFADRKMSHEEFTAEVARVLAADVRSHWTTAGMHIECHKDARP